MAGESKESVLSACHHDDGNIVLKICMNNKEIKMFLSIIDETFYNFIWWFCIL